MTLASYKLTWVYETGQKAAISYSMSSEPEKVLESHENFEKESSDLPAERRSGCYVDTRYPRSLEGIVRIIALVRAQQPCHAEFQVDIQSVQCIHYL